MNAAINANSKHRAANDTANTVTLALSGVHARFGLYGISDHEWKRLCATHLPHAMDERGGADNECAAVRADEIEDVLRLLLDHRSDDDDETRWLAHAIATACLGANHLYQDMGFPHREVLSELLRRHFSALFDKNTGNMKWKKFFYKQLCDRAEINMCKAPSCGVCEDYKKCFGAE
ncbi:MAG: nitrogen fixation protein NifQ [Pseudomonadota bacterium]